MLVSIDSAYMGHAHAENDFFELHKALPGYRSRSSCNESAAS